MLNTLQESLWRQFGASIDMLKNAILLYPEERWHTDKRFFYISYHCLIFLDYYLTIPPGNFSAPLPFTIAASGDTIGEAVDDLLPDRIYSKAELLDYLQASREKCHAVIASLTADKLSERWIEEDGNMNYAFLELLLYNMRHVQHHAAQLNLLLRQSINTAPDWIGRAEDEW
jgi:hypothetical protein